MVETAPPHFYDLFKDKERQSLLHFIEQTVRERALSQHYRFEQEVWGEKVSFHNERHIIATYHTIEAIFRNIQQSEDLNWLPEYLDPYTQLDRYNQMITAQHLYLKDPLQMTIQPDELEQLLKITFLMHDTGNTQVLTETGPVDLDMYRGIGAEPRSMENAAYYLSTLPLTAAERTRYQSFINYITGQTVFVYNGLQLHEEDKPFGVLTRFIDVIGQGVANRDELMQQVTGLILEQSAEDPDDFEMVPANTYAFLWKYASEIVPDPAYQEIIERLLGASLPPQPEFQPHVYARIKRSDWVSLVQTIPSEELSRFLLVPASMNGVSVDGQTTLTERVFSDRGKIDLQ